MDIVNENHHRFLTIESRAPEGFCQSSEVVDQDLKRTEIDFQARKGDDVRDDSGSLSAVSVSSSSDSTREEGKITAGNLRIKILHQLGFCRPLLPHSSQAKDDHV